jgi:tRNA(fMet)-specific endonuclease VapC
MYLLDTNACVQILTNRSPKLVDKFKQHNPSEICLCSVVISELYYGARKSAKVESNIQLLRNFLAPFFSFSFDDRCAEIYGILRVDLERNGTPIGPNDLMIAAIVKTHDLILITNNVREFSRISDLNIEDWQ